MSEEELKVMSDKLNNKYAEFRHWAQAEKIKVGVFMEFISQRVPLNYMAFGLPKEVCIADTIKVIEHTYEIFENEMKLNG